MDSYSEKQTRDRRMVWGLGLLTPRTSVSARRTWAFASATSAIKCVASSMDTPGMNEERS